MSAARPTLDKLRRFVRQRYYAGHNADANAERGDEDRPLNHIVLAHMVADDRDVQIETFPTAGQLDDHELDSLAGRIEHAAEEHCEGLAGTQRYRLAAYYERSNAPNGVVTFALRAVASEYTSASVSEPANDRGLLAQLMRHLDNKDRALLAIANSQAAMIERQGVIIDALQARQIESIRLTEELLSDRHGRELAATESKARIEHRAELVTAAKTLIPAMANRLAKRDVFPAADQSAKAALARGLLDSLSSAQVGAITEALDDDELRAEWLGIMSAAIENRERPLHEPIRRLAAKLPKTVLMAVFAQLTPMQQMSIAELLDLRSKPAGGDASTTRH